MPTNTKCGYSQASDPFPGHMPVPVIGADIAIVSQTKLPGMFNSALGYLKFLAHTLSMRNANIIHPINDFTLPTNILTDNNYQTACFVSLTQQNDATKC